MKKLVTKHAFLILLVIIEVVIFASNVKSGSFLIGWDNLMPELNPLLNIKRSFFSIWQEYRGLGLYDGMAHAANLIHSLFVGFLTLFLPQQFGIRYFVITLLHLLGGMGMYILVSSLINKKPIAFITSLFYMFNIGIIQQFYAPLEVFAFHFAFLPWILWAGLKYIKTQKKQNILLFSIIVLLSTPQGFVPTVFIASLSVIIALLVVDYISHHHIRNFAVLFAVYLAINSFWLIPYLYGAPSTSKLITNARINKYSSETLFLRNKQCGSLMKVLSLNGFMLNLTEYDSKASQNINLMAVWEQHSGNAVYQGIHIVFLSFGLIGVLVSIRSKKNLPFTIPLLVAFFFLANDTPLVRELNQLLRTVSPILGEAFRIPFTKWITVFTFSISLFIAFGLDFCISKIKNVHKMRFSVYILLIGMVIFLGFPAFQGDFFSNLVRRQIPLDYLSAIAYFKSIDKNKRIALLPAHTFWNWQYRSWGHVGSGFLWYGIQQPILERAFDPWSNLNEQFYNEFSTAINTNNHKLFTSVLNKYNIDYLLLDQYIVNTLSSKPINYESLLLFLNNDENIVQERVFGKLVVYRNKTTTHNNFLYSLSSYVCTTQQGQVKSYKDIAYAASDGYVDCEENGNWIKYPFANLFSEVGKSDVNILSNDKYIILESKLHNKIKYDSIQLNIPPVTNTYLMPFTAQLNGQILSLTPLLPRIFINDVAIDIPAPRLEFNLTIQEPEEYEVVEKDLRFQLGDIIYLEQNYPNTIIVSKGAEKEYITVEPNKFSLPPFEQKIILPVSSMVQVWIPKIESSYTTSKQWVPPVEITDIEDLFFENSYMPHQEGYIAEIESEFLQGLPINIYADNGNKKRPQAEMKGSKETEIQFMIIPPSEEPANGYTFHFENTSIGSQVSKTLLKRFTAYPIPYEFINTIQFGIPKISEGHISERVYSNFFNLYEVTGVQNTEIAVLSQAFDPGWKAYLFEDVKNELSWTATYLPFLFGKEIKEHVLVNNWANGWALRQGFAPQGKSIVLIFWPQYLEFAGFGILITTLLGIMLWKKPRHAKSSNGSLP